LSLIQVFSNDSILRNMSIDLLSADVVQLIGTFLDAASAVSLSRVNFGVNQHCLPPDCPFWRHALLHLLPPRVSETGALLARSPNIHPANLRGLVASLAKAGNFAKVKYLREKEKLRRYAKPAGPRKKLPGKSQILARLLRTGAAEAALARAEPVEAARVLLATFATLPPHTQRRLRESAEVRRLVPELAL
jgi:hypothetical protein